MRILKLGLSRALLRRDIPVASYCFDMLLKESAALDSYLTFCALELFGVLLKGTVKQKMLYMILNQPSLDKFATVITMLENNNLKVDSGRSALTMALLHSATSLECQGEAILPKVVEVELPWWVYTSSTQLGGMALKKVMESQNITQEQADVFCFFFWDYFSTQEYLKGDHPWAALLEEKCEDVLGVDADWAYSVWSNYMEPEIKQFIGEINAIDK
jgi:hypothetical protein